MPSVPMNSEARDLVLRPTDQEPNLEAIPPVVTSKGRNYEIFWCRPDETALITQPDDIVLRDAFMTGLSYDSRTLASKVTAPTWGVWCQTEKRTGWFQDDHGEPIHYITPTKARYMMWGLRLLWPQNIYEVRPHEEPFYRSPPV